MTEVVETGAPRSQTPRSTLGVFSNRAFAVIVVASAVANIGAAMFEPRRLADDKPQPRPNGGVGGPVRSDASYVLLTFPPAPSPTSSIQAAC